MNHDEDEAAELARRALARAADRGDAATELRATLELGQALLRTPIGESLGAVAIEVDLDAAEEAYRRAIELAEQVGDDRSLAAALREIGMIEFARARSWFADEMLAGRGDAVARGGDRPAATSRSSCSASADRPARHRGRRRSSSERSRIYERIGDRTGVMSTVIAMAYARYGPVMHLTASARHLEEIRRVTSRLSELVTESERDRLDLQMLFGVHVYSRAKVVPDLALSRGEDAHRAARLQGDRTTEFLAAGGVAMGLLELGDLEGAERWLGKAAGGDLLGTVTKPLHPARDLARDGPGRRRRRGWDAQPPRVGGRDGDRGRAGVRAVRGAGPPGARGCAPGRARRADSGLDPELVELVERSAAAGEGRVAAPARPCAMGRTGRHGARDDRPCARRHRGCGHARRRRPPGAGSGTPRGHQPGDPHPGGPCPPGRGTVRVPGFHPWLPADDPVTHRPGHGRRDDPRPVADRAGRARAGRACRPAGRAQP